MLFRRPLVAMVFAGITGVSVYACTTEVVVTPTPTDGGTTDGGGRRDVIQPPPDDGGDGGNTSCKPGDVSGFTPAWKAPTAPRNLCSLTQIDTIVEACYGANKNAQTCATLTGSAATQANKNCYGCMVNLNTAATWNAATSGDGIISVNIGGCMALLGGTAGDACGKAVQAASGCTRAACIVNCPVTDDVSFRAFQQCSTAAQTGGCKTYEDAVTACEASLEEAGTAGPCFAGQTFADRLKAIAPVFCVQGDGGVTPVDSGIADAADGG